MKETDLKYGWTAFLPIVIAISIALMPIPQGLSPHAWYYFAIFAGLIAALVVEPLPSPAVALITVTIVAVLSPWVLFSPADFAKPGFTLPTQALSWALHGFSESTVWLVFGAFMFALGYEKTGLGRRIALILVKALGKNTLTLGFATTFADALLAPATPSNTARSAGTIFPIVRNLPPLYDSQPYEASARKVGSYIMWVTFAAGCITSSLFMTACAPNFLALGFIKRELNVEINYLQWMLASVPWALPMMLLLPILAYVFYPPQIKRGEEVPTWAAEELNRMGKLSARETILLVLVLIAIFLWVFAESHFAGATVALFVIAFMLVFRVVTWQEMAGNHAAWTVLVLLGSLVTLAGGLSQTGFIKWFAAAVQPYVSGYSPTITIMALVAIYFFAHYMFASLTAHTTALMPVMLGVGKAVPGLPLDKLGLALAMTTGIMGVITPYATGPGLAYYESGYLPSAHFWGLGTVFGLIWLAALILVGVPLLMAR
jgi:L-tartrate/succinate antiporter